jgi:hypothetical protein
MTTPQQQDSADVQRIKESYSSPEQSTLQSGAAALEHMKYGSLGEVVYDETTYSLYVCYGVIDGKPKWRRI